MTIKVLMEHFKWGGLGIGVEGVEYVEGGELRPMATSPIELGTKRLPEYVHQLDVIESIEWENFILQLNFILGRLHMAVRTHSVYGSRDQLSMKCLLKCDRRIW